MDTEREIFVDQAIEYAAKGWKPYPIQPPNGHGCSCRRGDACGDPGKHPYHELGGLKSATKDKRKLKTLFGQSDANVGLICQGFWVLDVEEKGIDELNRLIEENGDLPATPRAMTGGGGRHYFFADDSRVRKGRVKVGGLSIDTPSQVVAVPSIHESGREYQWLVDPATTDLAKAPEWLIDVVSGDAKPDRPRSQSTFAFEGELDLKTHSGEAEGGRNAMLCRLVGTHLARHGDTPDLLQLAIAWNDRCRPPANVNAVKKTVAYLVAKHLTNNPQGDDEDDDPSDELTVRSFREIKAKPIPWLWKGRFPIGKLTLLTGDGGVGKSMLTCDMAATITQGRRFSDGSDCPRGKVFFIGGEDGAEDTIRPRLDAAGADVDLVFLIGGPVPKGEKYASPVDLSRHMAMLDRLLSRHEDAKLLVIDPIMDYLGSKVNSDKATEVRSILSPLRELAERHEVAIVTMNHLNRNGRGSKNRSLGSGAFVHVARMELRVCEDPDDPERRLLLPVKNNLSAAPGLAYRIVPSPEDPDVGRIVWEEGTVDISIAEVEADDGEERTAIDEAVDWISSVLADGPAKATDMKKDSRSEGIAERTLARAKKKLRIRTFREENAWWWDLPKTTPDESSESTDDGDSVFVI